MAHTSSSEILAKEIKPFIMDGNVLKQGIRLVVSLQNKILDLVSITVAILQ